MTTTDLSSITVASDSDLTRMAAMDVKAQIEAAVKSALDEEKMRRAAQAAAEVADPEAGGICTPLARSN